MKLPDLFTKDSSQTDSVIDWVSANLFFIKQLELPSELDAEDVYSFAELTIEEASPFPLEQLAWGYYIDSKQEKLTIFAACKPRIPAKQIAEWEEKSYVFPVFLPLCHMGYDKPTIVGISHKDIVSVFRFDGKSSFPDSWAHHVIETPTDEEGNPEPDFDAEKEAFAGFAKLTQAMAKAGDHIESGLLSIERVELDTEDLATISMSKQAAPEAEIAEGPSLKLENMDVIWASDLRENEFIEAEKKRRHLQGRLWQGLKLAGICAAVLLVFSLINSASHVIIDFREKKFAENQPAAMEVTKNRNLLEDLQEFTEDNFMPFEVLSALNKLRPKSIYFEQTSTIGYDNIRINGIANSVNEINQYSEKLINSGLFQAVAPNDVRSSGRKVIFTLKLRFESNNSTTEAPEVASNQ